MIQIQCMRTDVDCRCMPIHETKVNALNEHQHQGKYTGLRIISLLTIVDHARDHAPKAPSAVDIFNTFRLIKEPIREQEIKLGVYEFN